MKRRKGRKRRGRKRRGQHGDGFCVSCRKVIYQDEETATIAARYISWKFSTPATPLKVYQGHCGFWHLSRKTFNNNEEEENMGTKCYTVNMTGKGFETWGCTCVLRYDGDPHTDSRVLWNGEAVFSPEDFITYMEEKYGQEFHRRGEIATLLVYT